MELDCQSYSLTLTTMNKKIFWDEQSGSVYWLEDGEVRFAPMSIDNTCELDSGGVVEVWSEDGDVAADAAG